MFSRIGLEQGLQPAQFISAGGKEFRFPESGRRNAYMDAQTAVWYAEICNQLIEVLPPVISAAVPEKLRAAVSPAAGKISARRLTLQKNAL